MKKLIYFALVLLIIAFCVNVFAENIHNTKKGYYFAFSKKDLEDFTAMYGNDNVAANKMIASGRVCPLKEGLRVYLVRTSWGLIQIRPEGFTQTVWTYIEAID